MRHKLPPAGLSCPNCGAPIPTAGLPMAADGSINATCGPCGTAIRARPRAGGRPGRIRPPIGGLALFARTWMLRGVMRFYRLGLGLGTIACLALGGFLPVVRAWIERDDLDWAGVVALLGGVPIRHGRVDPDADYGPILRRAEAPRLFDLLAEVAARVEARPPDEVRLAYLPCCGVVAWDRSRALLLGLPLLPVLTVGELRAVLAHELAHLARGDATWSARVVRSVEVLAAGLYDHGATSRGPLRWWGIACERGAARLLGPMAEGQEARADRCSGTIAGGADSAAALIKVALVQPLFRELLELADPDGTNLYATFRRFWERLPVPLVEAMRANLLATPAPADSSPHPPLLDRLAHLAAYPDRRDAAADRDPAIALLGDPEWVEQDLHDRLFRLHPVEPSVFHRAGR